MKGVAMSHYTNESNGQYEGGLFASLTPSGRRRDNGAAYEAQAWLWEHKLALVGLGALMLALLGAGGFGG